jgi:hypothetical protein
MSVPRESHTMTLLPTGKVLVAGGGNHFGSDTRQSELYDPDTGQWTTTGAQLDALIFGHTATLLPTGKVLVVGGYGLFGPSPTAELYDPATGEWQATGALALGRMFHTATLLASGQVLVLAGYGVSGGPSASAELYDPATGTWTPATPVLARRFEHTTTLLRSGKVLVAGGVVVGGAMTEAELSDIAATTWRPTGSLFAPHAGHTATLLPSGKVLVVGEASGTFATGFANADLFDPDSETWSDAGCTNQSRVGHTATLLPSGAVLVAGGSGDASAELYGIIVSPAQLNLAPGASQTFTAKGGSGLGYVWSFVQNESGGTLTASGDYQAGSVGGVTDELQVMDSFANSSTATVNVLRQTAAVSSTTAQARSVGCGATGSAGVPSLGVAVLLLLGWCALRMRRRPTS